MRKDISATAGSRHEPAVIDVLKLMASSRLVERTLLPMKSSKMVSNGYVLHLDDCREILVAAYSQFGLCLLFLEAEMFITTTDKKPELFLRIAVQ